LIVRPEIGHDFRDALENPAGFLSSAPERCCPNEAKKRCVWVRTKSAFPALGEPLALALAPGLPMRAFSIAKIRRTWQFQSR
jgi:hypothetical protein